jgi:hypothetical protein
MAKSAKRSAAARQAAKTRAKAKLQKDADDTKQMIANAKPDLSKYEALGSTPEERREAARKAKIAEIKQRQKSEADAKATTRSKAGKQAAATRQNVKAFKQDGQLRSLVAQIREASDDEAVTLLRKFLDK